MEIDDENIRDINITKWVLIIAAIIILIVSVVIPLIKPWWAMQSGKAELAQAEQNRQIAVLEAQAKYESSIKLAQAEIERAKGVSEANKIIAGSITEGYLKYLFVQGLQTNNMQTIYVPTNNFMPVYDINQLSKS